MISEMVRPSGNTTNPNITIGKKMTNKINRAQITSFAQRSTKFPSVALMRFYSLNRHKR